MLYFPRNSLYEIRHLIIGQFPPGYAIDDFVIVVSGGVGGGRRMASHLGPTPEDKFCDLRARWLLLIHLLHAAFAKHSQHGFPEILPTNTVQDKVDAKVGHEAQLAAALEEHNGVGVIRP